MNLKIMLVVLAPIMLFGCVKTSTQPTETVLASPLTPIADNDACHKANLLLLNQEYSEAAVAYKSLANSGVLLCQISLGVLYEQGLGVDQDYVIADHWYIIASRLLPPTGVINNQQSLELQKAIEHKMSPSDIMKAHVQADSWLAQLPQ